MTKIIITSERSMNEMKPIANKMLRKFRRKLGSSYEIIIDCPDGLKRIKGRNKTDL